MVRRWTALGVVTAQKEFRRIKGYRHMGALVHALRSKQKSWVRLHDDSDESFHAARAEEYSQAATRPNSTAAGTSPNQA